MQPLFHGDLQHKQNKSLNATRFAEFEADVLKNWVSASALPSDIDTLSAYEKSAQQIRTNPVKETEHRRAEFRAYIGPKIASLLGEDVAKSVTTQLETNHSISTAEHYIPLSPNSLNAVLFNSLAYFDNSDAHRQNVIVFGCSGVSISNPWYARGYLFHSLIDQVFIENQLNFFGRAQDSVPVISANPYNTDAKKAMMSALSRYRTEKLVKKREFNLLRDLLEKIIFSKEVLKQHTYIDQITLTNFALWNEIFSSHASKAPNLIFLSQEEIAKELILRYHLKDTTPIHEMIFNKKWHELIYKHFDNIPCAFSVERQYGTFLFWATPKDTKARLQLFMKDGVLSSVDGSYALEVTPENIKNALENNDILPNVMLTFTLLSLYYGFFLTGGLMQPAYLSMIKDAYTKMLRELGEDNEADFCEPIIPNSITMPRPALAFIDGPNGQRVPASGLDLYLYGNAASWPAILDAMKHISVKTLYYRMYPGIYKTLNKNPVKKGDYLAITEEDIDKFARLKNKIPAWATLQF